MNDQSTNSASEPRTLSPLGARVVGSLLLICCGVIGYLSIYTPLRQAQQHAASLHFSDKAVAFVPVVAIVALMTIIFPKVATYDTILVTKTKNLSLVGWLVIALLLAIGAGFYMWYHAQLKALGYQA